MIVIFSCVSLTVIVYVCQGACVLYILYNKSVTASCKQSKVNNHDRARNTLVWYVSELYNECHVYLTVGNIFISVGS
jgi:hypothetical protein